MEVALGVDALALGEGAPERGGRPPCATASTSNGDGSLPEVSCMIGEVAVGRFGPTLGHRVDDDGPRDPRHYYRPPSYQTALDQWCGSCGRLITRISDVAEATLGEGAPTTRWVAPCHVPPFSLVTFLPIFSVFPAYK